MVVKTPISLSQIKQLLTSFNLGKLVTVSPLREGTVQSNYFIETICGKYVFRLYENRSFESVCFERDLLLFLNKNNYPCPNLISNCHGDYTGSYHGKPFMIMKFFEGMHINKPSEIHKQQLIQKVAELQIITQDFKSPYCDHRWNYSPELCFELAQLKAKEINTGEAYKKLSWIEEQISNLELPDTHPKGICHCDFHFSNVLYQGEKLIGLIDFDDANLTYLTFDLVCLIDSWTWPFPSEGLYLEQARRIVKGYEKYRPLFKLEREHLFDVHKLSILFDCIWYFSRGSATDFYEQQKIDYLDALKRNRFLEALFY